MRNLDQVTQQIISSLLLQNSPLTDFTIGSVNRTLIRSIASVQLEQDALLKQLEDNILLLSGDSNILDKKLSDFGITRIPASFATGVVLFKPKESNVNLFNTILTDLSTGNQYSVTSSVKYVNYLGEQAFDVIALNTGSNYNLDAGTKLTASFDSSLSILVGSNRTADGVLTGDISNGVDKETDQELTQRFINLVTGTRFSTSLALRDFVLSQNNITFVSIDNPLPGYINIWYDSSIPFTTLNVDNLRNTISNEIPAGVQFNLKSVTKQLVDIKLRISNFNGSSDTFRLKLQNDIKAWFINLNVNEVFNPNSLLSYLNTVNYNVASLELEGIQTLVTPLPDNLITVNDIYLTFGL